MFRLSFVPPADRRAPLWRGAAFWPVCVGHLLGADALLGAGPLGEDRALACGTLAALLAGPPSLTVPVLQAGGIPRGAARLMPKGPAQEEALLGYWRAAWDAPGRFLDAEEARAARRGRAARKFASTAAQRLLLRVARVPGLALVLGDRGLRLIDLPVQDALALVVADDELDGARYLDAETAARLARSAKGKEPRQ